MDKDKFDNAVVKEAELLASKIKDIKNRPIVNGFTIDDEKSMDLDDGINLIKKDGKFQLQVSIADVTSVVTPDTKIFKEAFKRVETQYYANSHKAMIPRILSENFLSLLPNRLTPAITFYMDIDENYEVEKIEIKETLFRNLQKFSYKHFDSMLNDKSYPFYQIVKEMTILSNLLYQKRRNNGAFIIYDLEKGIITNEEGMILPWEKEIAFKSYIVIQEFMILTNKSIAMFMANNNKTYIYRNHTARQNTPDRKDIIQQINTAILNPNHLASLQQRSSLWFNRAEYDIHLKGHFGLNEIAYSHTTSPIRRVCDLLNHILIKSYLQKQDLPFKPLKLQELTNHINDTVLKFKKKKDRVMKSVDFAKAIKQIQRSGFQELTDLDNSQFTRVLRAAVSNNNYYENLEQAFGERIKNGQIEIPTLYVLLFKNPLLKDEWRRMKKLALDFIISQKGIATQLVYVLEQKEVISNLNISEIQDFSGYKARISAEFEDDLVQIETQNILIKKKEAINFACIVFIHKLLKSSRTEADILKIQNLNPDIVIPKMHNSQINDFEILDFNEQENYVGKLQEIVSHNAELSSPEYTFNLSGLQHNPIAECTCKINYNDTLIEVKSQSNSKKTSKQKAAFLMLKRLENNYDINPNSKLNYNKLIEQNYIGLLQEYCLENNIEPPKYDIIQISLPPDTKFKCKLELMINDEELKFEAIGPNKKMSKQLAAKEAYDYIENNLN